MNRRNFIALSAAVPLAGCGVFTKKDAVDAARGAAAVAEAESIFQQMVDYLDGDEQAMNELQEPAAFFQNGLDFIQGDFDKPVVELLDEALTKYPEYVENIPKMWGVGIQVFADYAERSGKPVPQNIIAWRLNGEAGWRAAQKAYKIHDVTLKVVEFYKLAKPLALLVL